MAMRISPEKYLKILEMRNDLSKVVESNSFKRINIKKKDCCNVNGFHTQLLGCKRDSTMELNY